MRFVKNEVKLLRLKKHQFGFYQSTVRETVYTWMKFKITVPHNRDHSKTKEER